MLKWTFAYLCAHVRVSQMQTPRRGFSGLPRIYIFIFTGYCQIAFQSDWANLLLPTKCKFFYVQTLTLTLLSSCFRHCGLANQIPWSNPFCLAYLCYRYWKTKYIPFSLSSGEAMKHSSGHCISHVLLKKKIRSKICKISTFVKNWL